MPFGQSGYIGPDSKRAGKKPFVYPADFIMEGLDQTRGRFRGMHVCGNGVMKKNSFNNVIINGLVLAEDGKKMSKKLHNYPDPEVIFSKYGADAYRLYLLASPGVRAEPVKFSEKGVEQIYKDFTASILNAYKFFETYAKVDQWKSDNTTVYCMSTSKTHEYILEQLLRTDPDIIYTTNEDEAIYVRDMITTYRTKNIDIKTRNKTYQQITTESAGKSVLIISDAATTASIWKSLYDTDIILQPGEILLLPNQKITNELDRRILSELHNLGIQQEQEMDKYFLDTSAKLVL